MKNNDESYNQFLADLRRNSVASADDSIPSVKPAPSAVQPKPDASKLEQVLTGKRVPNTGVKPGYDDLINSLDKFRVSICAELIDLYDRIKTWATVFMVINIVSAVAWLIAYIWANSLDDRAVLELARDNGVLTRMYVWATSSSLVYVIVAVAVAIISGLVRRRYKYRSLYVYDAVWHVSTYR